MFQDKIQACRNIIFYAVTYFKLKLKLKKNCTVVLQLQVYNKTIH